MLLYSKSFRKKKQQKNRFEIVLITSNTILLTCIPPLKPSMKHLFTLTYFYLWKSLFIYDNLWESFLFVRIFLNPSYLWESLLIYDHLCESIFLSLWENKQEYEYHYLKQIFYHQNTLMIFCWFCMFQFYVFWFEFFLFCVWLLFYSISVFGFIKLTRNIYSFCRIRFFTINIFHGIHLSS